MNTSAAEVRPLKIRAINFSFSFILWLLLNVLFFAVAISFSVIVLNKTKDSLEEAFVKQGQSLSQSLLSIVKSNSLKKREDFAKFSEILQKVSQSTDVPFIGEIFILDKVGRVLAHSDFTQISPKARQLVDEIHPRYHKEIFHAALNLKEGQVKVFAHPESKPILSQSLLLKFFPEFQQVEKAYFSTPLYEKKEPYATLHVLLSRQIFTEDLLWLEKKIILLSALFLLLANLIWAVFLFAFVLRVNFLERLWKNHFVYLMENSLLKQELQKKLLQDNQADLETKKRILPSQKEMKEPVDAILLEE